MDHIWHWKQCLYCGRPVTLVGDARDDSKHRLAGGWIGSVHDIAARCSTSFVPQEQRSQGRTHALSPYTSVYRPGGGTTYITAVGVLDPGAHRVLRDDSDVDQVVITKDGTATLCRDDDLWMISGIGEARTFLPLSVRSMDDVERLDSKEFEHLIADLLYLAGCRIAQENGRTNDKGADVIPLTPSGRRIVVECKHWRKRARFDELAKVGGTARQLHKADDVWVVALSGFTAHAIDYARSQDIKMVGRAELGAWLAGSPPEDFATRGR